MCHGAQRVRCWLCIAVSAAADDELPGLVSTESGVTHVLQDSLCTWARLTEWWVCALTTNSFVPPSHQASLPGASRCSPSVVLVPVSSPHVLADGCGCFGCTSPCVSCWIPVLHSRYSLRDGRADLRDPEISPPALPQLAVLPGCFVASTTEMFVTGF